MKKKINDKFLKLRNSSYDPNLFKDEKFIESDEYLTKIALTTMRKKTSKENIKRFASKS